MAFKVSKLTSGYRIRCTDAEFEALKTMTVEGLLGASDEKAQKKKKPEELSGRAKSVLRTPRFTQPGGPLATVDEVKQSTTEE